MSNALQQLNRLRDFAPLIIRVVLGALFILHGFRKFDGGIANVADMFAMWGVPASGLTAPLTAIIEIVAGAALLFGLGTRLAALLLSVVMVGAILFVKLDLGVISSAPMPGSELDLSMIAGLLAVVILGPGRYSVDAQMGLEPTETAVEPVAGRASARV